MPVSILEFIVEPSDTPPDQRILPAIKVALKDDLGEIVSTATNQVTIAIDNNPSGGVLSGTTARNAVAGIATFNDLKIDAPGVGYTLVASVNVIEITDPEELPDIWEWWEPSREVGLDDTDPMPTLTGQHAGKNFTQASAGNRPSYLTDQLNSLAIAQLPSGKYWNNGPDMSSLTAAHFFMVIKVPLDPCAWAPDDSGVYDFSTAALASHLPFDLGLLGNIYDGAFSTTRKTVGNTHTTLTQWSVYEVVSTPLEWTAKQNSTILFTTGSNVVSGRVSTQFGRNRVGDTWDGSLAGMYLFSAKVSSDNLTAFYNYLNNRFGLNIPISSDASTISAPFDVSTPPDLSNFIVPSYPIEVETRKQTQVSQSETGARECITKSRAFRFYTLAFNGRKLSEYSAIESSWASIYPDTFNWTHAISDASGEFYFDSALKWSPSRHNVIDFSFALKPKLALSVSDPESNVLPFAPNYRYEGSPDKAIVASDGIDYSRKVMTLSDKFRPFSLVFRSRTLAELLEMEQFWAWHYPSRQISFTEPLLNIEGDFWIDSSFKWRVVRENLVDYSFAIREV